MLRRGVKCPLRFDEAGQSSLSEISITSPRLPRRSFTFPLSPSTLTMTLNDLPNETLIAIFRYLLDDITPTLNFTVPPSIDNRLVPGTVCYTGTRSEKWLSRVYWHDQRDGRHRLVPVSRVCQRWNILVNGILYEEIQVIGISPCAIQSGDMPPFPPVLPRNCTDYRWHDG